MQPKGWVGSGLCIFITCNITSNQGTFTLVLRTYYWNCHAITIGVRMSAVIIFHILSKCLRLLMNRLLKYFSLFTFQIPTAVNIIYKWVIYILYCHWDWHWDAITLFYSPDDCLNLHKTNGSEINFSQLIFLHFVTYSSDTSPLGTVRGAWAHHRLSRTYKCK